LEEGLMSISMVRRLAIGAAALVALLALPLAVSATVGGGCTAEGHSTSSSANITTDTEWHLQSDDIAGGSGTAPSKMTSAQVAAYALGIALPIAGGTSKPGDEGSAAGSVDGVAVATYAVLGKRFVVGGSASGPGGSCSGEILIVLDDVNPLFTLLGGGGILVALVAILILLGLSRGGGGCLPRLVGGAFGLLGGTGAALAGEQFGVLDPTEIIGLIIAIAAGIVGFLLPGIFHGGGGDTPAPAAPSQPAPARTAPMTPDDYGNTATDIFKGGDAPADPSVGGSASGNPDPDARLGAKGDEPLPPGSVGGGGPM
jgi:hypothetical protein